MTSPSVRLRKETYKELKEMQRMLKLNDNLDVPLSGLIDKVVKDSKKNRKGGFELFRL